MLRPLFAAVLFCALPLGAVAEDALYVLDASETEDAVYFYSAADGALIFEKRPADRKKDPAAGFGHPALVEVTNVVVFVDKRTGETRSAVERWTDRKGHAHTLGVLKDQVAFAADSRLQPMSVSTVSFSGILDRETLLFPHARALFRLESQARRFQKECEKFSKGCVGPPWPNPFLARAHAEVLSAAQAVKALEEVLEGIPLVKPAAPAALTRYPFAGLDAPPPGASAVTVDYALSEYLKAATPQSLRILPKSPGPGADLGLSRDPRQIDPGTLQRMAEGEQTAALKLDAAGQVLDDFFGKTP